MPTLFVISDGKRLVPHSKAAAIALEKLNRGVPLKIDPKQPRNVKAHRLFWAFATYVADALNDGPGAKDWTQDDVVDLLKLATGHVRMLKLPLKDAARLGTPIAAMPASISFAAMDQQAFGKFMDRAFIYTRDELCPWINESPHWKEIAAILAQSKLMEPTE
jgi:hypothetical protein